MRFYLVNACRWVQERRTLAAVLGCMALLISGPFLLRPADAMKVSGYDRRLVILTPHHEAIRQEFARGFTRFWKETTGEQVYVDWRAAGTSELAMILKSDFTAAFQSYWTVHLGKPWTHEVLSEFMNPKAGLHEARQCFLQSNVSVGADLFFGGGPPDFMTQADLGTIVARDAGTGAGLTQLMLRRADWFSDSAIPSSVRGEVFRDSQQRWCGTALSSFGIVFNRDVLSRLGVKEEPTQWMDLAKPELRGQIALADPTKSGSVNKAFEMLIQQQMALSLAQQNSQGEAADEAIAAATHTGWQEGLRLIQKISANARYFTDSAPKIPLEVSQGSAAAGMCIDFHGRSAEEQLRDASGRSRVGFVAPVGGTSVAVDPVAMLRGAPEPVLAEAFIEYVLSTAGQRLWCYAKGAPGGPQSEALRRLPVRKDFYTEENFKHMPDAAERPYEKAASFTYHPEWTASVFNVLRFVIRASCVDTHHEQREAWAALVKAGFPPRAMQVFSQMDAVTYDYAKGDLASLLRSRDKVREVQEARRLVESFRQQYVLAKSLAERH